MSESENKGWNERRFFQFNPPKNMPDDPASTLPNLETNPARYPDPPKDKETPAAEGSGDNPPPTEPYPTKGS